jgi:hypothetical protein
MSRKRYSYHIVSWMTERLSVEGSGGIISDEENGVRSAKRVNVEPSGL